MGKSGSAPGVDHHSFLVQKRKVQSMEGKNPSKSFCPRLELDSYLRAHELDVCRRSRTNPAV